MAHVSNVAFDAATFEILGRATQRRASRDHRCRCCTDRARVDTRHRTRWHHVHVPDDITLQRDCARGSVHVPQSPLPRGGRRSARSRTRARSAAELPAADAGEWLRTHRDDNVRHGPCDAVRRSSDDPDRPAHRRGRGLDTRPRRRACPHDGDRRDLHRRCRCRSRLPRTPGRNAQPIRAASAAFARTSVPNGRSGALECRRRHRIPRANGQAGENPRLSHRAGRDCGGHRPAPTGTCRTCHRTAATFRLRGAGCVRMYLRIAKRCRRPGFYRSTRRPVFRLT